jgi:hypothetical protein
MIPAQGRLPCQGVSSHVDSDRNGDVVLCISELVFAGAAKQSNCLKTRHNTPPSSSWALAATTFHRIRARLKAGYGTSMYIHNVKAALLKHRSNSKLNQCLPCNMPHAKF